MIKYGEPIPKRVNKFRCKQSILVTSSMLNDIMNILRSAEGKLARVYVFRPINDKNELNNLIKKHSNENIKISMIDHRPDPNFDKTECLWIRKR